MDQDGEDSEDPQNMDRHANGTGRNLRHEINSICNKSVSKSNSGDMPGEDLVSVISKNMAISPNLIKN